MVPLMAAVRLFLRNIHKATHDTVGELRVSAELSMKGSAARSPICAASGTMIHGSGTGFRGDVAALRKTYKKAFFPKSGKDDPASDRDKMDDAEILLCPWLGFSPGKGKDIRHYIESRRFFLICAGAAIYREIY